VTGTFLTVQLANGFSSYPELKDPGTCTADDGSSPADCRVYVHQN
jgi:hypothetical protein